MFTGFCEDYFFFFAAGLRLAGAFFFAGFLAAAFFIAGLRFGAAFFLGAAFFAAGLRLAGAFFLGAAFFFAGIFFSSSFQRIVSAMNDVLRLLLDHKGFVADDSPDQ